MTTGGLLGFFARRAHCFGRSNSRLTATCPVFVALLVTCFLAVFAAGAPSASANLNVFYTNVGNLKLSVDAIGTNQASGIVRAEKPAGATVSKAFLFAASTGDSDFVPPDDEVTLDGNGVSWEAADTIPSDIASYDVVSDVTSLVKPKLEAASPGLVDFTVSEADTDLMDGEILVVIFNDPNVRTNTIDLLYGAQSTFGDEYSIGLAEPLKSGSAVTMGLGISFGYQPDGQYSTVDVNGTRMTSSAGGQDDCFEKYAVEPDYLNCENGTLITAGGIGDSTDDPPEPFATDLECIGALGPAPRCDDELYNLKPFVAEGASTINVATLNPSNNDNIFFASLDLEAATAVVGAGLVLEPADTRTEANSFHFMTALAQNEEGEPEVGRDVTLEVISGPSAGYTLTSTTNSEGKASFNYLSSQVGTDTMQATYTDRNGVRHTSNEAAQTWTAPVIGTFGGEWPYNGSNLTVYYSYGGSHRYLGNVSQGVSNWNHAGTHVQFAEWPGAPYAVDVPIIDVNTSESWWGMTVFQEDCSSCGYTRNTVELNEHTLAAESDAQRTKVATHELGHTLGLEHPYGYVSPSVPSVMWQGSLGGSVTETPQPFDVERVNGMYP
jgi:hypothetical protein